MKELIIYSVAVLLLGAVFVCLECLAANKRFEDFKKNQKDIWPDD